MTRSRSVSEATQPGLDFVVGHHVIGGEQALFRKENNPPLQPRPALKQILPEKSDSKSRMVVSRMVVGISEALRQCAQRRGNLLPLGAGEPGDALPQATMEFEPHSLPVKGLDCPAFLAAWTSAFTV